MRTRAWALAAAAVLCACSGSAPRGGGSAEVPALAKAVLRTARSYLPEEERGRREPKDCSSFVRAVFAENGLDLPRTSRQMAQTGESIASARGLRMGDLVFFSGEKAGPGVGHVGIYVNNGIFIHKPTRGGVVMESIHSDYYRRRYLSGRRVIP